MQKRGLARAVAPSETASFRLFAGREEKLVPERSPSGGEGEG
jgi:hypothetical protein